MSYIIVYLPTAEIVKDTTLGHSIEHLWIAEGLLDHFYYFTSDDAVFFHYSNDNNYRGRKVPKHLLEIIEV